MQKRTSEYSYSVAWDVGVEWKRMEDAVVGARVGVCDVGGLRVRWFMWESDDWEKGRGRALDETWREAARRARW